MATDKATPIEPAARIPSLGLRHLMFLVLAAALVFSAAAAYWRFALFFILTLSPVIAVVAIVAILLRRRAAHQQTLLRILTIAAERDVPISKAAEAFAQLGSGRLSEESMMLGRMLGAGEPFPRAIQRIPNILPRTAAALASVGWSEQSLAKGLREAEDSEDHRRLYSARIVPRVAYLLVLLFALEVVGGFFLYWVMPKFQAIFQDFGVDLPGPTIAAIQVGRLMATTGVLPLAVLLQVAAAGLLAFSYMGLFTARLPGAGWLLRRPDAAAVLRALAITVEAGRPIGEGLSLMGGYYRVGSIPRKLHRVRDRIDQGHPWAFALRDSGLLRPADIPILDSAEKAGNLPWALRTVASGYERRFGYGLQVFAQFLLPLIVVGVGAIVGLFAVGYFLPLVELIRRLGS
ncbi:MAG: type II secretion system F family protein [Isosphaeraceae bacterium]